MPVGARAPRPIPPLCAPRASVIAASRPANAMGSRRRSPCLTLRRVPRRAAGMDLPQVELGREVGERGGAVAAQARTVVLARRRQFVSEAACRSGVGIWPGRQGLEGYDLNTRNWHDRDLTNNGTHPAARRYGHLRYPQAMSTYQLQSASCVSQCCTQPARQVQRMAAPGSAVDMRAGGTLTEKGRAQQRVGLAIPNFSDPAPPRARPAHAQKP